MTADPYRQSGFGTIEIVSDHPQAKCQKIDFVPSPELFIEYSQSNSIVSDKSDSESDFTSESNDTTDSRNEDTASIETAFAENSEIYTRWSCWGSCSSISGRQLRVRKCKDYILSFEPYKCDDAQLLSSRECINCNTDDDTHTVVSKFDDFYTEWSCWSSNDQNQEVRSRNCKPDLMKFKPELCSPEATTIRRVCSIQNRKQERPEVRNTETSEVNRYPDRKPNPLSHCEQNKYKYFYQFQVEDCLVRNRCFVFRNWNTAQQDPRRIPTLLDCFEILGFTEKDKKHFIHKAFILPKLKKSQWGK